MGDVIKSLSKEGHEIGKALRRNGFRASKCRRAMWFILLGAKSFILPGQGPDAPTPWWYSAECSENPYIRQGKDSPEDKNKTPHREMQGLIFLCRRLSVIALHRINHIALRHSHHSNSTNPIIWGCILCVFIGKIFAILLMFHLLFSAVNFLSIKIVS